MTRGGREARLRVAARTGPGRHGAGRQACRGDRAPDEPRRGLAGGLRWIVRRTKPSRRQQKNLTAFEKATGWRYSFSCTNIPATGIDGVPGSHHPQFIDVTHREHAVVEDGVRAGKAMGLRNLPSKSRTVNCGWVLASNIAADLAAWSRLLGLHDCDGLKDAEPDTLRPGISPPAWSGTPGSAFSRSARTGHGRRHSLPAGSGCAPCPHPPDQDTSVPGQGKEQTRRGRIRRIPGRTGQPPIPPPTRQPDSTAETRHSTISNQTQPHPESSRSTRNLGKPRQAARPNDHVIRWCSSLGCLTSYNSEHDCRMPPSWRCVDARVRVDRVAGRLPDSAKGETSFAALKLNCPTEPDSTAPPRHLLGRVGTQSRFP